MRKKLVSKTYMKGVTSWEFVVSKNEEENFFLCIKKINKIDKPFTVDSQILKGEKRTFIDNGYYILEFTPMDKNYNGRVYLDENLNELEYYFDISLGNGVEDNIPYYDDLYLDLIFEPNFDERLEVVDEDELKQALEEKTISLQEYDLAFKALNDLSEEIKQKKNVFVNLDKRAFVRKYFN